MLGSSVVKEREKGDHLIADEGGHVKQLRRLDSWRGSLVVESLIVLLERIPREIDGSDCVREVSHERSTFSKPWKRIEGD